MVRFHRNCKVLRDGEGFASELGAKIFHFFIDLVALLLWLSGELSKGGRYIHVLVGCPKDGKPLHVIGEDSWPTCLWERNGVEKWSPRQNFVECDELGGLALLVAYRGIEPTVHVARKPVGGLKCFK